MQAAAGWIYKSFTGGRTEQQTGLHEHKDKGEAVMQGMSALFIIPRWLPYAGAAKARFMIETGAF